MLGRPCCAVKWRPIKHLLFTVQMPAVVETKSTSSSVAFKLDFIQSYFLSGFPTNYFLWGSLKPLLAGIFSTMHRNDSVYSARSYSLSVEPTIPLMFMNFFTHRVIPLLHNPSQCKHGLLITTIPSLKEIRVHLMSSVCCQTESGTFL